MNQIKNIHFKKIIHYVGIFCVLLSVILILNTLQLYSNSSIETHYLSDLTVRLSAEQNSPDLLKELRNFDALAHKALFCSPGQIKTCLYLFILGVVVLGITVTLIFLGKSELGENTIWPWVKKKFIMSAFILFILTLTSSFISLNYFKYSQGNGRYNTEQITLTTNNSATGQIKQQTLTGISQKSQQNKRQQEVKEVTISNEISEFVTVAPKNEVKKKIETNAAKNKKEKFSSGLTAEQIKNNHNSFRGPFGNGISYHKNIPVDWDVSTGKNLVWKTKVPKPGNSSPIIWQNKLFLTGADNESCVLFCFDMKNGKILWTGEIVNNSTTTQKLDKDASFADPTATTNGELVFAIFGTGDLICFDTDGNKKWNKSLGVPQLSYGYSSSLVTWDDKLFVQFDTNQGGKLFAFETKTGKTIWETKRKINQPSWASPVLTELNRKMQVILTVDPIIAGYDVQTGEEIWSVECMSGEVAPSVTVGEEIVYAGMEYANVVAVNPAKKSMLWETSEFLPEVSSPVVYEKFLFVASSYGDLACYHTETGEVIWEKYCEAGFYSSPMIANNKLYVIEKTGVTHVVELTPEIQEINSPELNEECYTTPAFSEGRIFIRGKEHLFCFGNQTDNQQN